MSILNVQNANTQGESLCTTISTTSIILKLHSGFLILSICALCVYFGIYNMAQNIQADKRHHLEVPQMSRNLQTCLHLDFNEEIPNTNTLKKSITCDTHPDWLTIRNGCVQVTLPKNNSKALCNYIFFVGNYQKNVEKVIDIFRLSSTDSILCLKSDYFRVSCVDDTGAKWKSTMAGIQHVPSVQLRTSWEQVPQNSLGLSVLVWTFESLSRADFIHHLPLSYSYLKTLDTLVFKGYNGEGNDTRGSLLPLLTGRNYSEVLNASRGKENTNVFIWNDFRKHGYVTGLADDTTAAVGVSNYWWKDVDKQQPPDHDLRPFYVSARSQFKQHKPFCLGTTPRHKIHMNWIMDFFTVYKNKPKFLFSFHSELSRDNSSRVEATDNDFHDFLNKLNRDGHLNNSILIITSDRAKGLNTSGKSEQDQQPAERHPMFAMVLPLWFENQHPKAWKHLRTNMKRLTTPFDVHATLKNVLNFRQKPATDVTAKGISVFKEVSKLRTCEDAGIDSHWCTCLDMKLVWPDQPIVMEAADNFINFINELIENEKAPCQVVHLERIERAEVYVPKTSFQTKNKTLFHLLVYVTPGCGHFEFVTVYDSSTAKFALKASDVSRTDEYSDAPLNCSSKQIVKKNLRKYCVCRPE